MLGFSGFAFTYPSLSCNEFQADVDKTHSAESAIEVQIFGNRPSHVTEVEKFSFFSNYPLSSLTYLYMLTSPSKLWVCNLDISFLSALFFVWVSAKARPVKCIFYFKSEVWFSSLGNSSTPNISKLTADVFPSIKSNKKPNSYSVLLLICLSCFRI